MFDLAVIGGGITGCMSAYFAQKAGLNVVLYEKEALAAGASGAAGAFISPRLGKGGELQGLTNEAFSYARQFYKENFPALFDQSGIYRIAKDSEDAKLYGLYSEKLTLSHLLTEVLGQKAIFFEQAGAVDAQKLCEALVKDVAVVYKEVTLKEIEAKHIIMATGADKQMVDLDFIGLRKTWGVRIDTQTSKELNHALHKDISISATKEGITKVGATHEKEVTDEKMLVQKGKEQLLKAAKELLKDREFTAIKHYSGTRSAVRDYFPIASRVVDVEKTLTNYPMVCKGIKPRDGLIYHKDLYIIGGTGGRGFVFAPFLAKELLALITKGKAVDSRIDSDRLFYKWARKLYQ